MIYTQIHVQIEQRFDKINNSSHYMIDNHAALSHSYGHNKNEQSWDNYGMRKWLSYSKVDGVYQFCKSTYNSLEKPDLSSILSALDFKFSVFTDENGNKLIHIIKTIQENKKNGGSSKKNACTIVLVGFKPPKGDSAYVDAILSSLQSARLYGIDSEIIDKYNRYLAKTEILFEKRPLRTGRFRMSTGWEAPYSSRSSPLSNRLIKLSWDVYCSRDSKYDIQWKNSKGWQENLAKLQEENSNDYIFRLIALMLMVHLYSKALSQTKAEYSIFFIALIASMSKDIIYGFIPSIVVLIDKFCNPLSSWIAVISRNSPSGSWRVVDGGLCLGLWKILQMTLDLKVATHLYFIIALASWPRIYLAIFIDGFDQDEIEGQDSPYVQHKNLKDWAPITIDMIHQYIMNIPNHLKIVAGNLLREYSCVTQMISKLTNVIPMVRNNRPSTLIITTMLSIKAIADGQSGFATKMYVVIIMEQMQRILSLNDKIGAVDFGILILIFTMTSSQTHYEKTRLLFEMLLFTQAAILLCQNLTQGSNHDIRNLRVSAILMTTINAIIMIPNVLKSKYDIIDFVSGIVFSALLFKQSFGLVDHKLRSKISRLPRAQIEEHPKTGKDSNIYGTDETISEDKILTQTQITTVKSPTITERNYRSTAKLIVHRTKGHVTSIHRWLEQELSTIYGIPEYDYDLVMENSKVMLKTGRTKKQLDPIIA